MSYLLDTNAVSEWVKPRPDPGIVRWLDEVDEDRTYLSVITIGEIRKGVPRLADGRRRDRLDRWLAHELPERFGDRMLPVDTEVADEWGRLLAGAEDAGATIGAAHITLARGPHHVGPRPTSRWPAAHITLARGRLLTSPLSIAADRSATRPTASM